MDTQLNIGDRQAKELMESLPSIAGEVRQVVQCKQCGQLIGRRFIPYGLGAGVTVNPCLCWLTQCGSPVDLVLEMDP